MLKLIMSLIFVFLTTSISNAKAKEWNIICLNADLDYEVMKVVELKGDSLEPNAEVTLNDELASFLGNKFSDPKLRIVTSNFDPFTNKISSITMTNYNLDFSFGVSNLKGNKSLDISIQPHYFIYNDCVSDHKDLW